MSKPTLDNNPPRSLIEELSVSLQSRFGRTPRQPEPVVYEFTTDWGLLNQYYRVREKMYRKIHNTSKFTGKEDSHDKIAHILIARRGKLCIGGCRLIVREGDEDFQLPMEEHDDFKVRDAFLNLPLTKLRHAEISRFAVLDEDDDKMDVMLTLTKLIIEKCISLDVAYVFIKSPGIPMARKWRKIIAAHCGQQEVKICTNVKMPEDLDYPEISWQLIITVLPAAKIMPASSAQAQDDLDLPQKYILEEC